MVELIGWISANWTEIANIIVYVIAIASIIVKITPTPKDDIFLGKIKQFISQFIALNPKK